SLQGTIKLEPACRADRDGRRLHLAQIERDFARLQSALFVGNTSKVSCKRELVQCRSGGRPKDGCRVYASAGEARIDSVGRVVVKEQVAFVDGELSGTCVGFHGDFSGVTADISNAIT